MGQTRWPLALTSVTHTFDWLTVFPALSLQNVAHCLRARPTPWSSGQLPDSQLLQGTFRFTEQDGRGALQKEISEPLLLAQPWTALCVRPCGCPMGVLPPPCFCHKEAGKQLWRGRGHKSSRDVGDKLSWFDSAGKRQKWKNSLVSTWISWHINCWENLNISVLINRCRDLPLQLIWISLCCVCPQHAAVGMVTGALLSRQPSLLVWTAWSFFNLLWQRFESYLCPSLTLIYVCYASTC